MVVKFYLQIVLIKLTEMCVILECGNKYIIQHIYVDLPRENLAAKLLIKVKKETCS